MKLVLSEDAGDPEREFRTAILRERRDAIAAGKAFAAACISGDVAGFYAAVDQINETTVDGWRHAAIGVSRLRNVASGIREAFLSVWIEHKHLPLDVGHGGSAAHSDASSLPGGANPALSWRQRKGTPLRLIRLFVEHRSHHGPQFWRALATQR